MHLLRSFVATGLLSVIAALASHCTVRAIDPDATPAQDLATDRGYLSTDKDVDLLFVLDNSSSSEQFQQNLIANFDTFLRALRHRKFGGRPDCADSDTCRLPNLRIGVVSTDLGAGGFDLPSCRPGGDGGKLQTTARVPGCHPAMDPWISHVEGVLNIYVQTNDPVRDIDTAFACVAALGTGGCNFEQPLESARRALLGCGPPTYMCDVNPGFIRKGARLVIVFVSDTDDCSAQKTALFDPAQGSGDPLGLLTHFRCTEFGIQCNVNGRQPGIRHSCVPGFDWLVKIEDYATAFAALKPPGRVTLFAVGGPIAPFEIGVEGSFPVLRHTCQSQNGLGTPAIRIAALTKAFGIHGIFNRGIDDSGHDVEINICSVDFRPALKLLAKLIIDE